MRRLLMAFALLMICGCSEGKGGDDTAEDTLLDTAEDTVDISTDTFEDGDLAEAGCIYHDDCDDSDPCTTDECNTGTGDCEHDPVDGDGDGYPAVMVGSTNCGGTDCDDTADDVHPDADDTGCDWVDHDCDTVVDVMDDDGDGYGDATECSEDDCDDAAGDVHPGADDTGCDWVDHDCDTVVDVMDDDGDGYSDAGACGGDDCDDEEPTVYPDAPGVCLDGVDQDCDSLIDDLAQVTDDVHLDTGWYDTSASTAWTGSEFGVLWTDPRVGDGQDVVFQRISADGTLVGSTLKLTNSSLSRQYAGIVWTGSDFGCTWNNESGATRALFFARIASDGTTLVSGVAVSGPSTDVDSTAVTWTGSEFAAVWSNPVPGGPGTDIFFTRWTPDGTSLGSDVGIAVADDDSQSPDIAWTGSAFGVVWTDDRHDMDPDDGVYVYEIYLTTVSSTGVPAPTPHRMTDSPVWSTVPSLVWAGTEFGLSWMEGLSSAWSIHYLRVAPEGTAIGTGSELLADMHSPKLIWTGSRVALFGIDGSGYHLVEMNVDTTIIAPLLSLTGPGFPEGLAYITPVFTGTGYGIGLNSGSTEIWFTTLGYCDSQP